jgi:ABC-type phosphate transport system permease subunit
MAANIYHLYNEAALLPDAARVASGESAFLLLVVLALMLLARLVSWFFKRKTRVADRFA